MELHEFQIAEPRAGPPRHRQPVAGGDGRVGRLLEDAARASCREQHRGRRDRHRPVIGVEPAHSAAPAVLDLQARREHVIDDLEPLCACEPRVQAFA